MPSPRLNNLTRRITRNSRKKLIDNFLSFFFGALAILGGYIKKKSSDNIVYLPIEQLQAQYKNRYIRTNFQQRYL